MSLEKDGKVHCDYHECGGWTWQPGSQHQCPGCGTWYSPDGKFVDRGPYRTLREAIWKAGMDHFNRIHKEMYRLKRELRELRAKKGLFKKRKRRKK